MYSPYQTDRLFLSPPPPGMDDRESELLPIGTDFAEDDSLRFLRDQYNIAKMKAKELNTKNDVSLMKPRTRKAASKLYSAVATVIYTTISSAKINDVEKFVQKRSMQVPDEYFDGEYWRKVLMKAAEVRSGAQSRRAQSSSRSALITPGHKGGVAMVSKPVLNSYFHELDRHARDIRMDHNAYKAVVTHELAEAREQIVQTVLLADEKLAVLLATLQRLESSNSQLQSTNAELQKYRDDREEDDLAKVQQVLRGEADAAHAADVVEKTKQQQLQDFLELQRQQEEDRKRTDLAVMEKHRQEFGAVAFEHREKMKEMQAKHDLQIKNITQSHNLAIEQLIAKIAEHELLPPIKDMGSICRDCDKNKRRIVELEASLEAQSIKCGDLDQKLSSVSQKSAIDEVKSSSMKLAESVLCNSFSNIDDILEKSVLRREIDDLKAELKSKSHAASPPAVPNDATVNMLETQLVVNKNLVQQVETLQARLKEIADTSPKPEGRLEIIRRNSSLITMNFINGSVAKTVSAKADVRMRDLTEENCKLKQELEQQQKLCHAMSSQNQDLQLQEMHAKLGSAESDKSNLLKQVFQLQEQIERKSVGQNVTDASQEQLRQQLNEEIRLNEELAALNLKMQEQLVTTTADYTKLQFQQSLTAEQIMGLRQKITDLETSAGANDKRMRDAAIVGTTASLRRQQSSHLASNIVTNAIASSIQKSAYMKAQSFKGTLEAEEVAQLRKTITDLQRQLTGQDMQYSEKIASLQVDLANALQRYQTEAAAWELAEQRKQTSNAKNTSDSFLYRQISAAALRTVNEAVIASVLNSVEIINRSKYNSEACGESVRESVDAFGSHFSAELANKGIIIAAPGTVQGDTGWYTVDSDFMYFCNINDEFVLLCGPLSEMEYQLALSNDKLSLYENSTVEMNQLVGSGRAAASDFSYGNTMDPHMKLAVELCAIRGNQIQRDRLSRNAELSIDLVLDKTEQKTEDYVSIELTKEDDDNHTIASISVNGSPRGGDQTHVGYVSLQEFSEVEAGIDEEGNVRLAHGTKGLSVSLNRINSSMYIKDANVSASGSLVSMTASHVDEDDDKSAMLSISEDGHQQDQPIELDNSPNTGGAVAMPNIVTTVIIKMLRREIQHLKELSIADSQVIAALKARVFDDESTMASDTDYIRSMNKKLLSESNLAALYNESPRVSESPRTMVNMRNHSAVSLLSDGKSPRDEDDHIPNSARRKSKAPNLDVVVEESGTSTKSVSTKVPHLEANKQEPSIQNPQISERSFSEPELLGVIRNLREEVRAYRGMLQDDTIIISALKSKLGLEDTDEIEIPGYIGVHSVRTSDPIEVKSYTDNDPDIEASDERRAAEDDDGISDENIDLKHKVHILRNLMVQQGTQVRDLMRALEDSNQEKSTRAPQVKFTGDHQPELELEKQLAELNTVEDVKEQLIKLHTMNQDQLSIIRGYEIQINSLQLELNDLGANAERDRERFNHAMKDCRQDLSAARSSLLDAGKEIEKLKYRNELKELSTKSQLPGSNREDDEKYKNARLIQSRIRIFMARQRVRHLKQMLLARAANVLFALKNTRQGETGWYAGPDGSLFYFVLDGDSWILASGPVPPEEYEEMILKAAIALSGANKSLSRGDILVRCNFELGILAENSEKGELFMSAKTHKLLLASQVDAFVISDGSRLMSDGSNVLGSNSFVEDSNSMILMGGGETSSTVLMGLQGNSTTLAPSSVGAPN